MSYDADWERPGATETANNRSNLDFKAESRIPRKLTRKKFVKQQKKWEMNLLLTQENLALECSVAPSRNLNCGVEKEEQKRDAKREELNLVERQNVGERAAAEQNAVEEKDNLKKRTIII